MYGGVVCIVFGGLVGSMLFVDVVVCNMVELMGVMFVEVIYMVSLYLVWMLGVDGVLGSFKLGKCVSIVVLDSGLYV